MTMTNTAAFFANPTDCIDSNTLFGEVKKIIISKDFKGGKINNVFGKTELDFTNADIQGLAVLDISETFGETVIIVPEDWRVETDQTLIMATFEDNRQAGVQKINPNKVLIITGCSIFASIKIIRRLY